MYIFVTACDRGVCLILLPRKECIKMYMDTNTIIVCERRPVYEPIWKNI